MIPIRLFHFSTCLAAKMPLVLHLVRLVLFLYLWRLIHRFLLKVKEIIAKRNYLRTKNLWPRGYAQTQIFDDYPTTKDWQL